MANARRSIHLSQDEDDDLAVGWTDGRKGGRADAGRTDGRIGWRRTKAAGVRASTGCTIALAGGITEESYPFDRLTGKSEDSSLPNGRLNVQDEMHRSLQSDMENSNFTATNRGCARCGACRPRPRKQNSSRAVSSSLSSSSAGL